MTELMVKSEGERVLTLLQSMAAMEKTTNDRMTELEESVRQMARALERMEKITPAQQKDLSRAIRDRAAEVCRDYRITRPGDVETAIRRSVRRLTGTRSAREISRCDWPTVLRVIGEWDDYKEIRKIREAKV